MLVEITQFLRPDGRQVKSGCEVSNDLKPQYEALKAAGCRLTLEMLMSGEVSQTIEHEEGDYDIVISMGEDSPKARLEQMLARFDRAKFDVWLKTITE